MSLEKNRRISVAVDGPAGAGKSSISKVIAKQLGYTYLDTGAMYRGITWALLEKGVSLDHKEAIQESLDHISLTVKPSDEGLRVFINDHEVTSYIRSQEVNNAVSIVAAHKEVRAYLVSIQREMAAKGGIILDGRDIGSVVLPKAELKLYVTASVETRGHRRWLELKDKESLTLAEVCESVAKRDAMDQNREESPLVCVSDAVVIQTDNLAFNEVVAMVSALIIERSKA